MPYAARPRDRTSYDTFGRVWTSTTPSAESRFAFTGRDLDPESDLYHHRARYYDPATGQFISADPIGFEAGDGNLYRYVGNGPIDGTDPSGLEPPKAARYYVHPWEQFPGYTPGGLLNPNAGNNSGNVAVLKWFREDPQHARVFFGEIMEQWGGVVAEAAKANDIPEALVWCSVFAEMVNFGWADYHDFGASRGPGQLTAATEAYYGCQDKWDERPGGIGTARGAIFIKRLYSLDELGQITLPTSGGASVNNLAQQLYYLSHVLQMQAREIRLAARGGGVLSVPGGGQVKVPAMNPSYISGARFPLSTEFRNPPVGRDFHQNLARLSLMMVIMNRENPGATGGNKPPIYTGRFSIVGPQSLFVHQMFANGYFGIDGGRLTINAED
jgi:RHS repeat-associated protein